MKPERTTSITKTRKRTTEAIAPLMEALEGRQMLAVGLGTSVLEAGANQPADSGQSFVTARAFSYALVFGGRAGAAGPTGETGVLMPPPVIGVPIDSADAPIVSSDLPMPPLGAVTDFLDIPWTWDIPLGRSAKSFGAVGDGVTDDTAAIQAAINMVRVAIEGMSAGTVAGGIVYFPAGTYRTSSPLYITSGISLRGAPGAIIHNISADPNSAAIELVSSSAKPRTAWAPSVQGLTILTEVAHGISAASDLVLINGLFEDLILSTGNWAIYLPASHVYTQNTEFRNIYVRDFGAGVVWVEGNANRLRGIRAGGTARPTLQSIPGLVRMDGGGNAIEGCVIGGVPASVAVTAFHITGQNLYWRDNWHTLASGLGGAAYRFVGLVNADFDALNGLTSSARASFSESHGVVVGRVSFPAGQSLEAVLSADSHSAVRVRSTQALDHPVVLQRPEFVLAQPLVGLNARDFGARGNGVNDDTVAIQQAIDAAASQGVSLYLPRGRYRTTAPLLIGSNTRLIGEGGGTVLLYQGADPLSGAIEIVGTGSVADILIQDIKIHTAAGYALRARSASPLQINRLRMANMIISAGNWAVYLPASQARTVEGVFQNLQMLNSGGGAMWVDGDWNRFDAINTESGVRAGFSVEPAMMRIGGANNTLTGCVIEGIPSQYPVTAYYITGSNVRWAHNWAETNTSRDNVAFWFDKVNGMQATTLKHLTPAHKARFTQSTDIHFEVIDLNGSPVQLLDSFEVDAASRISMREVVARFDPGHLNDPRFQIGGFWNTTNRSYVDVGVLNSGTNLLPNGDFAGGMSGWHIVWGEGMVGAATVEDAPGGGKRLRVTVQENPKNTAALIGFAVPASAVGSRVHFGYTLSPQPGMAASMFYNNTISSNTNLTRVVGTQTATTLDLVPGGVIRFLVQGVGGSVYLQGVKMVLAAPQGILTPVN